MSDEASEDRKFRILSIDGGGVRGILPAAYLAEIEKGLPDGRQLYEYFDIIAGTSTGGIIAAALSLGISAEAILGFYMTQAKSIFKLPRRTEHTFVRALARGLGWLAKRIASLDLNTEQLFFAKYEQDSLRQELAGVLGDSTLSDARTLLLLTAVNLANGETEVFKSPDASNESEHAGLTMVDAVLATTAAPTYFPAHDISGLGVYADGGLWANNPGLVAYVEAFDVQRHRPRDAGASPGAGDITILSINTGDPQGPEFTGSRVGYGLVWWLPKLLQVVFHSQAAGTGYFLEKLLDSRLKRVGFPLTKDMRPLDSTSHLKEMAELGRDTAVAEVQNVLHRFVL